MSHLLENRVWRAVACCAALLSLTAMAHADETAPSSCGKNFLVSGDIRHNKTPHAIIVEGTTQPEVYAEDVSGKDFSAVVAGLPEGRYTVEFRFAETRYREAGKRVMDILHGNTTLAENLDLFVVAGFARPLVLTNTIDHAGDSINGPLTFGFKGRKGEAKFNAIEVRNAQGAAVACVLAKDLVELVDPSAMVIPDIREPAIYLDPDQPRDKRVTDLVRRMSLKEKVSQLLDATPPIERLSVPGYNYWNECLHGVARAGTATVFPQAIALAATWDPQQLHAIADVIATEARAKNNEARAKDPSTRRYFGLTFWTPNINIFRDPRWGRGHETYGEDPFLTARLGVAFITGLQGDDTNHMKAMACAKHFAVHSGPEKSRHTFNVDPLPRDLYETYLPQFEAAVREARVGTVMSAYNAVFGVPAPASRFLLTDLLRTRWGFNGHVVSDCDGISDIWSQHKYVTNREEAAALAIKAGNDLNCGRTYGALAGAVNRKLLDVQDLDTALRRVLDARFRLGLFDPPERCAYLRIPASQNDSPEHGKLALEAARNSIVLLKNDGVLPLDRSKVRRIALIGPNADSVNALLGNYNGTPSRPVTLRKAMLAEAGGDLVIDCVTNCPMARMIGEAARSEDAAFKESLAAAQSADVVVFAGGIDATVEGEEMQTVYEGFDSGDRVRIELPPVQTALLKALKQTGKPVILVNFGGGAMAMPWESENLPAIVQAWYPGQNGGTAIADVLFGRVNPSGRLPVTFYRSTEDLPAFENYSMSNRTYRYFSGKPLYPFGHGLSYTHFTYGPMETGSKEVRADGTVSVRVEVKNTGKRDGDEVAQLYVRRLKTAPGDPVHSLAAFQRVHLAAGASTVIRFEIPASALRRWDAGHSRYVVDPGEFEIQAGASAGDIRQTARMRVIQQD